MDTATLTNKNSGQSEARPGMRVTDELGKDLQCTMFCLDENGCWDSLGVPTRLARISPMIKCDDSDRHLSEGSKQI